MATTRHLIVFGAAIALAAALAHQDLLFVEPMEGYMDCRARTEAQRWVIRQCLENDFSEKALSETKELYKDSRCPFCMHVCRKQDEIRRCLRESWDVDTLFPHPSNRSLEMVPLVRGFVEESLHTLCENDAASLSVLFDAENRECLNRPWTTCGHHLEGYVDLDLVGFCEFTGKPGLDPFSKQFICEQFNKYFECGEEETRRCPEEFKTSVAQVMSIWRNSSFCSR
ncbi:uncharacterized protein LOC124154372 [Ischnura elegans]|uniref:uncharacterized protein LOC124154372 n=1 Tax=Ischnura elegans TaxID=197161 RepID=UPI001ED8A422|nr:uncharacterized protein LOC124154372 [Ischnura elegans]